MESVFIGDLDATLVFLYERQVTLERGTMVSYKTRNDPNAGPGTVPHYYCVDEGTLLANVIVREGRPEDAPVVFRFVSEQLTRDAFISRHSSLENGIDFTHYHITAAGKLFKERGGYHGRVRSELREVWKQRAKTMAAVINAAAVILLTWWAAQSANADKLKDDQITRLETSGSVMESRIHALETMLEASTVLGQAKGDTTNYK